MKPFEERKARERQVAAGKANLHGESVPAGTDSGRTAEKLAAKAGVGTPTVNRAIIDAGMPPVLIALLLPKVGGLGPCQNR